MFASVQGHTLYYESSGEGPAVVFIHGLGSCSGIWHYQVQTLGSGFRAVAYDWLGSGLSSKPHSEYSVSGWARELKGLCEALRIQKAALVGHSLGGAVAIEAAASFPGFVTALALLGPVTRLEDTGVTTIKDRVRKARANGLAQVAEAVSNGALSQHTRESNPSVHTLFRAMLLANDPECYALHCEALLSATVDAQVPKVTCPVLILAGDSDHTSPPDSLASLAAKFPDARIVTIPRGGHAMQLDRPGTVGRSLSSFFGQVLSQ